MNKNNKIEYYKFIIKRDWGNYILDCGWGNGYVVIHKSHPFFGKSYSDYVKVKNIDKLKFNGNYIGLLCLDQEKYKNGEVPLDLAISVHGGITFAQSVESVIDIPIFKESIPGELQKNAKDYWILGFDTAHAGDNKNNCNKEFVIRQTDKLLRELKNYG